MQMQARYARILSILGMPGDCYVKLASHVTYSNLCATFLKGSNQLLGPLENNRQLQFKQGTSLFILSITMMCDSTK